MLKDLDFKKIYIVTGKTDMRKGISGLMMLVRLRFGLDPLESGTLFLFCGNNRKTIKGLLWDDDGYVMITKTLTTGTYQWPRNAQEARLLEKEDYRRLMEGFSIESTIPRRSAA